MKNYKLYLSSLCIFMYCKINRLVLFKTSMNSTLVYVFDGVTHAEATESAGILLCSYAIYTIQY
jgi:hypothetical protein